MNQLKHYFLILALTFSVVFAPHSISLGYVSGTPAREGIKERLLNAAEAELPATEVTMTHNSVADLNFIITSWANELEQGIDTEEMIIVEAERQAVRFAKELKKRGKRQFDGRIRISRSTIAGWRDWFCPAYPVC